MADGIRQQLAPAIEKKNSLLPIYKANLPNSPVWLLIYSTFEVSRGVPIPHGISDWTFRFGFERVFFYTSLNRAVEEVRKG